MPRRLSARPLICLVSDRRRLAAGHHRASDPEGRLVELVGAAAHAGIDLVQLRERDLEAGALDRLVSRCRAAVSGTATLLVVNDRLDVALSAGADGVHLRSDSVPAAAVRALWPVLLVGRSVHSADEVGSGIGADYLVMGTIFPTASKPRGIRVAGVSELKRAVEAASIPVLAIGGVTRETLPDVARAGAAGVAAIGLFVPPPGVAAAQHLHDTVGEIRRAFDRWEVVP
jgi:thiamine-phosphate pyrophosphorylase